VPVMALPAVYEQKILPLGLEFHAVRRTSIHHTILVEMVYDIKNGTEHGLRNFFSPRCARRTTICSMRPLNPSAPTCCCWAN